MTGRDHRELFDRTVARGRGVIAARRDAIEICAGCPVLARCAAWVATLEPSERPRGVVAGQVIPYTDTVFAPRRIRR